MSTCSRIGKHGGTWLCMCGDSKCFEHDIKPNDLQCKREKVVHNDLLGELGNQLAMHKQPNITLPIHKLAEFV